MPARPKLADPGTLIRNGKLRTGEYRVCVNPDLVNEYEDLVRRRDVAKAAESDSLAGSAAPELDAQIDALLEQMEAATITLVLQALPRPQFRALVDKHPPRKDAEGNIPDINDRRLGVSYDAFFEELVRAQLVAPKLDPADRETLLDELLTDGQWDALTTVAWNINKTAVSVPFSPAASANRRNSSAR
jgi:hypothetical protein